MTWGSSTGRNVRLSEELAFKLQEEISRQGRAEEAFQEMRKLMRRHQGMIEHTVFETSQFPLCG